MEVLETGARKANLRKANLNVFQKNNVVSLTMTPGGLIGQVLQKTTLQSEMQ